MAEEPKVVTRTGRKVNYLNNRDILKEIHKSKATYCTFFDRETQHQQDAIVYELAKINKTRIKEAKAEVIDRHKRATGEILKPSDIPETSLVFRLMTWEHIPLVDKKPTKAQLKKRAKLEDMFDDIDEAREDEDYGITDQVYTKCNFPPFFHYMLNDEGTPYLVGKSHWKGDLETGEFSKDHGTMTGKLAHMFIKLCERYATRSNWRGYCVDTETEALTQRGWLSESEITEDDTILSYENNELKWSEIKSIYRGKFDSLLHKLTCRGMDALITPGHKLVTARGLVPVELLLESDKVIFGGNAVEDSAEKIYSDDFVELCGWIVTEGCYQLPKQSIQVYQNAGVYANRIRSCLTNLGASFSESVVKKNICFSILRQYANTIFKTLPEKNLNMEFILSLTKSQRNLLIDTMIAGDGWQRGKNRSYCQKDKKHVDLFQVLCAMSGYNSNFHYSEHTSYGKATFIYTINLRSKQSTNGSCVNFHGGKRNGTTKGKGKSTHPNEPTTYYNGTVWCPETEYGSFMARRGGKVYLTGNTYNEEMRGQALLQLSQIGLQFDEAKSQNPFAYYTAAITNSFTRILNIEKKNQSIRDDILEMNGLNPSWTRQNSEIDAKLAEKHNKKEATETDTKEEEKSK